MKLLYTIFCRPVLAGLLLPMLAACTVQRDPSPLPKGFFGLEAAPIQESAAIGWIGAEVEMNDADSLESLDLMPGVRVSEVIEGGPAAEAGIHAGDVLLNFDGTVTDDPERLAALLRSIDHPRPVTAELQRGSEVLSTEIQVRMKGGVRLRPEYFVERALLRAAFRDSDHPSAYPEVVAIVDDGPMAEAGVKAGELILSFQNRDPGSAAELVRRIQRELQPGDLVGLEVQAMNGRIRTVELRAWSPPMVLNSLALWPVFSWDLDREENREVFLIGDLFIFSLFKVKRVGQVKHWSILSLFSWETGRPTLQVMENEA
jgi:membrane-associated protease RseP (regulator of RpoE activity)